MVRKLILLLLLATAQEVAADGPSFRRDVMPILFRAGCNQGTCHGSSRGKDGFSLSLFGYDPRGDYFRLTREIIGRRVNVASPRESLLLLKATGAVPHTGGSRFSRDSVYYRTLLEWIAQGAPDDAGAVAEPVEITLSPANLLFTGQANPVQTTVTARYSDGTMRDVTSLALFYSNNPDTAGIDKNGLVQPVGQGDGYVFARFNRFTIGSEVIVLPKAADFKWSDPPVHNYIDKLIHDRLQKLKLLPSALADDNTFLRRVYLDLTGAPPSSEQYRRFVNDPRAGKRARLIDELLQSPEFTDLSTGLWAESVRLMGGGYTPTATDLKAAEAYYQWIRKQIKQNRPFDEFVYDQITASGSNLRDGPTNLYTMLVHDVRFKPKAFAADFSQLFLGIQIQCAECHNHPFDRWTMDDYYGFVSFFTGITRKPGAEPREFYIFNKRSAAPSRHKVNGRPMIATVLGGEGPASAKLDSRVALARWLTSPQNALFARNIANRTWARFFHRGLVEPVDDLRISNPPTNRPLLEELARKIVKYEFDQRALIRDICNSRTYQLASQPNATNKLDDRQFSRARLRRLRADVLLDSIIKVTEWDRPFRNFPKGTKAIQFYPRTPGDTSQPLWFDDFLKTFGRSSRNSICSCETRGEPTLSQTLHMVVGKNISNAINAGLVTRLLQRGDGPSELIEELFIRCLSRKPTAEELAAMLELVAEDVKEKAPYEDILWSLLNSTEFSFNH
ncbi:MAG TPA: cell surface protein [Planctomycetaceae bacterium]|nr:cell surface protein [Planctomycetaceae bacterium]